jgi:hypothetical protein
LHRYHPGRLVNDGQGTVRTEHRQDGTVLARSWDAGIEQHPAHDRAPAFSAARQPGSAADEMTARVMPG